MDVTTACMNGDITVLNTFLAVNVLPSQHAVNIACLNGATDVVTACVRHGVMPSFIYLNECCRSGYLDIIQTCVSQGVIPTQDGIEYACGHGHVDILNCLLAAGLRPTRQCGMYAAQYRHTRIVEQLFKSSYDAGGGGVEGVMDPGVADVACHCNAPDVLQVFIRHGVLPTPIGLSYALRFGWLHVVHLCLAAGVQPPPDVVNTLYVKGDMELLGVLGEYGCITTRAQNVMDAVHSANMLQLQQCFRAGESVTVDVLEAAVSMTDSSWFIQCTEHFGGRVPQDIIDKVFWLGKEVLISYVMEKGYKPSSVVANRMCATQCSIQLRRCCEAGTLPSPETVGSVLKAGYTPVLEVCKEFGAFPRQPAYREIRDVKTLALFMGNLNGGSKDNFVVTGRMDLVEYLFRGDATYVPSVGAMDAVLFKGNVEMLALCWAHRKILPTHAAIVEARQKPELYPVWPWLDLVAPEKPAPPSARWACWRCG